MQRLAVTTGDPTYAAGRLHGRACADQRFSGELLTRATALGRLLLTQDADFLEIAVRWQQQGIAFSGILFAPQGTPIGRLIEDAELCLTGMTADEFRNRLIYLPLR